jgi:hypothetical protein
MWTDELVERLGKYIASSRYFEVRYHGNKVYGFDPPQKGYPACVYLSEYDDVPPDNFVSLEGHVAPKDFEVLLLKPVEWQSQDPNWSEVDPDVWAAYVEATTKREKK